MRLTIVLCLSLSLFAQTSSPPPPGGRMTVTVVDRAGKPVAGVRVSVVFENGQGLFQTTDADGSATFDVPPGKLRVRAFKAGMGAARMVTATAPEPLKVELTLEPETQAMPSDSNTSCCDPVTPVQPQPVAPVPMPTMPREIVDVAPGKDYATVRIYYATDRAFTGENEPASKVFGTARGRLSRGIAHVGVPRLHRLGRIESVSVLRFDLRNDPKHEFVLLKVLPQRERDFYAKLRESVARSKKHEMFVFVHGFANTFDDAAKRTAQIKYDLAYDGPAVLFSWPSLGSAKPTAYTGDENNAEWATDHFRDFLLELAQNSGAQSISVVAHSMGNRILARAFKDLPAASQPRFDHVVLTAPDIDVDVFKQLAKAIRTPARNVTLYVSKNDVALKVSKEVHGNIPRAGDSSSSVLVVDGIDTVDVSGVDTSFLGHSYVAENRTVLSDIYCLIRGMAQAQRRCRLVSRGSYWEFTGKLEDVPSLEQYSCVAPACAFNVRP